MRMLINNLIDSAALSLGSGTEIPTLPLSNLQTYGNARIFRNIDAIADLSILADWDDPQYLSCFVLWRHNLSSGDSIRIRIWSGPGQTGQIVYDSGDQSALQPKTLGALLWGVDPLGVSLFDGWRLKYSVVWFDPVAGQSMDIRIQAPGNPDARIDIGRIYGGLTFAPVQGHGWGYSFAWNSDVDQSISAGGSVYTTSSEEYRTLNFNLDWLSAFERAHFAEAIRTAGRHQDVFLSLYPGQGGEIERDHAFVGKLQASPGISADMPGYYKTQISIREC